MAVIRIPAAPAGRTGMPIDYDKTFPESARSLALDGAQIVACLSACELRVASYRTKP